MKANWLQVAAVAGALSASSARAQDSGEAARQAMHEAMNDQAAMPSRPAALPDQAMTPGMGQGMARDQMHRAAQPAGQAVQHQAMHQGVKDAKATHADAANRAGMHAATSGATMGNHGDMHDAANKERMKEMHGGMMGSGAGGMMPGGTGGGMMPPPGSLAPTGAGTGTGTMVGGSTGTTGGVAPGASTPPTTTTTGGMPAAGGPHK